MTDNAELTHFTRIYREHFAFAWRSLRRLGVPERDLADATQDVFLVTYRKFAQLDQSRPLAPFIYAICLRVASDRRRSAAFRREHLTEAGEPSEPAEPALAAESDRARQAERRALLEAALDAMSLEQRAVFTLFELEGYTGEEVAALLGVPAATVHSRLRLAREVFRRAIERGRARERFTTRRMAGER
jgi:RNA polymerase sigma-70 factor (ECF subfamily)